MVQIHCCLTFKFKTFLMPNISKKKTFSSEIIFYFCDPNFYFGFFIQRSFSKRPKTFQRISVNKSSHIFKKSKERFILQRPNKIHFVTPFFSNYFLLRSFLQSIIYYYFFLSSSIQVKVINKVTFYLIYVNIVSSNIILV